MKIKKTFLSSILGAALLMAAVSCADDAEGRFGGDSPLARQVSFSFTTEPLQGDNPEGADPILSRATENGTFENGNAVGIYAYDKSNNAVASNIKYVYDSQTRNFKAAPGNDPIWVMPDTELSYYAYYPYKEGTGTSLSFTLPSDQSSSLTAADVLHGSATSVPKGASKVTMTFRHVLSFVTVNYGESLGSKTFQGSELQTSFTGGSLNVLTGTWTSNSTSGKIKPMKSGNTLLAIMVPQEITAGASLGSISFTDGTKRQVLLDNALSLLGGYRHTVTLGEPDVNIAPWETVSLTLRQENPSEVFDAIGSNKIQLVTEAKQKRIIRTYHGDELVSEVEEEQIVPVDPAFTTGNPDLTVSSQGKGSIEENLTESPRTIPVTATYEGKTASIDMTQQPNVFTTADDVTKLYKIELPASSSISIDACGHVSTPATATYEHISGATTTLSGRVISASETTYSTKAVTPSVSPVAENTAPSQKTVTITASYTEDGVTKTATASVNQPAAVISEASKTLSSIALNGTGVVAACGGTPTGLTCTATYAIGAKVTSCGTQVAAATTQVETVTPTYSSIAENTGTSTKSVTATATYNGKTATKGVTQAANTITGGDETLTGIALTGGTTIGACGGTPTGLTCTATYSISAKKTSCGTQVAAATTTTRTVNPTYSSVSENTTDTSKSVTVTASFNGKTATKSVTQAAATFSGGVETLTGIALSGTGSIGACGGTGVTGLTCTATYATSAKKTSCGTQVTAASTRTAAVTPSYSVISENTATTSRTATVSATYNGKTATSSISQAAGTRSGGTTTWTTTGASVSASATTVPSAGGTVTVSSVAPTYSTSAVKTGCGTTITAAKSGTATVTYSVAGTGFSISGNTVTVAENTGTTSRTGTVTATFSDGTKKTVTITQQAASSPVGGGSITIGDWGTGENGNSTETKNKP